MDLYDFFGRLDSWGFLDIIVPFLLIFIIIYAILQKTKILGEGKKNYNIVVALAISLAAIIPHVVNPGGAADVVYIINNSLPNVSVILIAIVMFLLLIGLMGGQVRWIGSATTGWIALLAGLVILYIFGVSAGWFGPIQQLGWLMDSDTQAIVIIILVFGLIIWFITSDSEESGVYRGVKHLGEGIGKLFGGGSNK